MIVVNSEAAAAHKETGVPTHGWGMFMFSCSPSKFWLRRGHGTAPTVPAFDVLEERWLLSAAPVVTRPRLPEPVQILRAEALLSTLPSSLNAFVAQALTDHDLARAIRDDDPTADDWHERLEVAHDDVEARYAVALANHDADAADHADDDRARTVITSENGTGLAGAERNASLPVALPPSIATLAPAPGPVVNAGLVASVAAAVAPRGGVVVEPSAGPSMDHDTPTASLMPVEEPSASPNTSTSALPVPQWAGLIADVLPVEPAALEAGLRQFLDQLESVPEQWLDTALGAGLTPWACAVGIVVAGGALAERRLRGTAAVACTSGLDSRRPSGIRHQWTTHP
jgi:hypothetical protein